MINEVDYQEDAVTDNEFVEIYNKWRYGQFRRFFNLPWLLPDATRTQRHRPLIWFYENQRDTPYQR